MRLPAPVEASVYFFVSEALTNVVKHAQAREATVSMAADDGGLTVEVGDDGVGGAQVARRERAARPGRPHRRPRRDARSPEPARPRDAAARADPVDELTEAALNGA